MRANGGAWRGYIADCRILAASSNTIPERKAKAAHGDDNDLDEGADRNEEGGAGRLYK